MNTTAPSHPVQNKRLLLIGGAILVRGLNARTRVLATALASRFARVDLVGMENFYAGPPATPVAKARQGLANLAKRRVLISVAGGVRRITVRSLFAPPPLDLLLQDIWYYANLRSVLDPPYDLGVLTDPRHAWLAWMLKRRGYFRHMLYDDCDYHGGLQNDALSRWEIRRREQLCINMADGVTTINQLLAELRRRQGASNLLTLPNGVDLDRLRRAREKRDHPPTLAYIGTLSSLWGLDLVIRAMPELARRIPEVRLVVAGSGPDEAALRALSEALGLKERVVFLGLLKPDELPSLLAEADVGVATSRPDSPFRKYASPLKVVEYMAAGLAVIATRIGQTEVMMRQSGAGLLIDYDVPQFIDAATRMFQDRSFYAKSVSAGISYAAQYDWALLMNQFHEFMTDIIDGGPHELSTV